MMRARHVCDDVSVDKHGNIIEPESFSYSYPRITGGDIEMVQAQLSETFLNGETVKALNITVLKILDEGQYVKGNFGEQLQIRVLSNDPNKRKYKWSLPSAVNDYLINTFGKDTAEWVGKEIKVSTEVGKKGKLSILASKV